MLRTIIAIAILPLASATGHISARKSRPLLELIASSTPAHLRGTPQEEFDCAWRPLAYEWAPVLQPWLNDTQKRELYDALLLGTKCKHHQVQPPAASPAAAAPKAAEPKGTTLYVSASHGSDKASGTLAHPLATLGHAVLAARKVKGAATVLLRAGTYHLAETIELGAADSGLTISSYQDERVIVSGGVPLTGLEWKPHHQSVETDDAVASTVYVADLSSFSLPRGVPALLHGGQRATLARYPNANPELDLFPAGYISDATVWMPPEYHGAVCDPQRQCGVSQNHTKAVDDSWHGMFQNYTVGVGGACERYDPPVSPWCSGDFYLLRQFPEMHTRSPAGIRATALLPHSAEYGAGSHAGARIHAWRPGHWYTWMFNVSDTLEPPIETKTWGVFPDTNAVSGKVPAPRANTSAVSYLGDFDTRDGCWAACNASSAAAAAAASTSASGSAAGSSGVPSKPCTAFAWHSTTFDDPQWRRGCYALHSDRDWASTPQDGVVSARGPHSSGVGYRFNGGGHQGGEGDDAGGEWFIEGVMQELDAPNEYYYDAAGKKLYFYPNASGAPDAEVVVPTLATLLSIKGTKAQPVRNVTISGVEFTASRPTFMEARTNPSGGDWALEREGAVRLEGTEGVVVERCVFQRLDSNAVSINGYNRFATVTHSQFRWLGQNAIASWGYTDGNDGTGGEQPRHSRITSNLCHEIGHIQKQSSFYFQALTAQALIADNIVFNIPRAALNFNDGFGGGAMVRHNLLFNTCRESGDHGAFNSWDRLPYLTDLKTPGTPSTVPLLNDVHHNFIVANYAADGGCLDNDDGSSYYAIHHNFCVYGGHKQNFDGHDKHASFNVYVYPQVYGVKCIDEEMEGEDTHTSGPNGLPPPSYGESYQNNVCILPSAGDPYMISGGVLDDPATFATQLALGNNTIYAPNADVSVTLSGDQTDFAGFQAKGFDPSSRVSGAMPSNDQIVAWGRALVFGGRAQQ